jgi:YVTN family beta-propeller protein
MTALIAIVTWLVVDPHVAGSSRGSQPEPGAAAGASSTTRSSSAPPTTGATVAGSDQTVALPGMPPVANPQNIYADAGANMLSPVVRGVPYRIYVPNSAGSTVTVIDPTTYRVLTTYETGLNPQHVVPGYNLRTLYVTNDLANSLTPIDPNTGLPAGPNIPVDDPYNMYFTPDGRYAVVVAEARQHLDFRNPNTFALEHRIAVNCAGVDHVDFAANGAYLIGTCEFGGRLVRIDLHTLTVDGYLNLPGSSPQDIKLDPTGHTFYVADKNHAGVWLIDAASFRPVGFIPTGPDAHGLYPSRNARDLYVTNRGNGSISVIDFATARLVATWWIPGGGSPDMGGVSPDGQVLWVSGRYNNVVYAISTVNGALLAEIPVGAQPHGLCVWPQPGRYSLGHTGITR